MNKTISFISEKDTYLRNILRDNFSSARVTLLKKEGVMKANGKCVRADYFVRKGEVLEFVFPKEEVKRFEPKSLDLKIVYVDEDYLVCDKGEGILCMPLNRGEANIFEGLALYYPNDTFHVITRLDKDTKGLVLLGRSALSTSKIKGIKKYYTALIEGKVSEALTIDKPIARGTGIIRIISEEGKPSCTVVTPVSFDGENTLVQCELLTGRTHQIRVHLASIGHPIVGDTLYGNGRGSYNSGQRLLCSKLMFTQPFTKREIVITSDRKI